VIVRDKPGPLQLLFAVRGSVLPHIWPELALVIAVAAAITAFDIYISPLAHTGAAPFAVFGTALSLFLGFRNNAAYDRWWEARKLWGGLLADTRSLAREAELFLPDPAMRHRLLRLTRAFLHLHRAQLRKIARDPVAEAATAAIPAPSFADTRHPPCAALSEMTRLLAEAKSAGTLDGFGAMVLSNRVASLSLAQAGCERIAVTPLPYVYSLLVFRTSWLFVLLLPLALIEPAGWLTPLFTGIVAYTFFGLAEVTEELAHPFGPTANALPLAAICRAAEISLAPHLDESAPEALLPQGFRLD
jgi:putative membrane protein